MPLSRTWRSALLCLGVLLSFSPAGSQVVSHRPTFSTPTATSLGRFGEIPVNLNTGSPDISIPLFTMRSLELELPVNLRYTSGGIRVEDVASPVGTGWALQAGGVVTRTVRGLADDDPAGYLFTGDTWYSSSDYPSPTPGTVSAMLNQNIDGEPDQYFFNFAGRSGEFVGGPLSTVETNRAFRTVPYQALRITPVINSGVQSWTITTEDGIDYVFGAREMTTDHSVTLGSGDLTGLTFIHDDFASSWFLTQIRGLRGDQITFYYSTYTTSYENRNYQSTLHLTSGVGCASTKFLTHVNDLEFVAQRLDSIKSYHQLVTFHYASTIRADAPDEPRLDSIMLYESSNPRVLLRRFVFQYSYFPGTRLRLDHVYERSGTESLPPYSFTYDSQTFPSRTSYAQDHFGYFNGASSNNTLLPKMIHDGSVLAGAHREVNPTALQVGALTRMTYPTGGYSQFTWEPNDHNHASSVAQAEQTKSISSGSWAPGWQQTTFSVGGDENAIVDYTASLSASCGGPPNCPRVEVVGHFSSNSSASGSLILAPGTYTLRAYTLNGTGHIASLTVKWRNVATMENSYSGGLRMAEIRTSDGMGGPDHVQSFRYRLHSDTTASSGVAMHPDYTANSLSGSCSYFVRTARARTSLGSSGGGTRYTDVTVIYGENGEFGSRRVTFTQASGASPPANPNLRVETGHWLAGRPLIEEVYAASGAIQRRQRSRYQIEDDHPISTREFRGMSIDAFDTYPWDGGYVAGPFVVTSEWVHVVRDTTWTFDQTGASPVVAAKRYEFGNAIHAQLTELEETGLPEVSRITRMRYPADFSGGSPSNYDPAGTLAAMRDTLNHIHSPVIERWVTEVTGGDTTLLSAEVVGWLSNSAGPGRGYYPARVWVLDAPPGSSDYDTATAPSSSLVLDSRHVLIESVDSVDQWRRPRKISDARGFFTRYTYGGPSSAYLTSISRDNPGGADLVTTLAWDSQGNLASVLPDNGVFRAYYYDGFGRLIEIYNQFQDLLQSFSYSYSRTAANGWTFQSTTPNAITTTTYRTGGSTIVTREYIDGAGRTLQRHDQAGSTQMVYATQYDDRGRVWRVWNAYSYAGTGYDTSFAANATAYHNTYHSTANAHPYTETLYAPDPLDRAAAVTPPFNAVTGPAVQYAYLTDPTSRLLIEEVTDEAGDVQRTHRDPFGFPVRFTLGHGTPAAATTHLTYDAVGRRVSMIDPRGITTSYSMNTRSLQLARISQDAGTANVKYDRAGNPRFSQDARQLAANPDLVSFTTYDWAGRPLLNGEGAATFASLDPNAPVPPSLETTQANWRVVRAYDAKPSTSVYPWSIFATQIGPLSLSAAGELSAVATRSNGAWQVTLFSYDEGRVHQRFTFTENGSGTVLTALNSTTTFSYDLRGAITERRLTVGSLQFNHWYDYDTRGLLWRAFASTGATKPASPDVTYVYRPDGSIHSRQYAGGLATPIRYTIRGQIGRIGSTGGTTYPFSARYWYTADGNVSIEEFYSAGTPSPSPPRYRFLHTYDALDRLTASNYRYWTGTAWSTDQEYDLAAITYDAAGNIRTLDRRDENGVLVDDLTYSYPSGNNRLSSIADPFGSGAPPWDAEAGAFTHDANGNILTAPAPYSLSGAVYDDRNLPLSFTRAGVTTSFRYDASGQRVSMRTGTGNTDFYVLDGPTTLAVVTLDPAGSVVSSYFNVVVEGQVIGREMAGVRRHYQRDRLGSTRAVMEGSTVVESYDYSPWGLLLAGRALVSSAPTRELFTGQEYDASTQLYYFGARYYMPAVGRWMSVDPSADALPGWSAYNYVLNNPGSATDPTGMFPIFGEEIYGTNGTVCTGIDSYECAARYGRTSIDDADEAAKAAKLDETAGNPATFSDPFGLSPEIRFADERAEAAYHHARRVLEAANTVASRYTLYILDRMEAATEVYNVFVDPSISRGHSPVVLNATGGRDVFLPSPENSGGHYQASGAARSFVTILLHELGHAGSRYGTSGASRHEETAVQFEDAYREALGWSPLRRWHD